MKKKNPHIGSSLDDFLKEEGVLEETRALALKETLAWQVEQAMKKAMKTHPRVAALHAAVAARPRIKAYMGSERRMPGNEMGTYRHYAELDG